MKVFLIGMPGSGKTTLGRQLAAHLLVDFIDLDSEIEKAEAKTISEIFRERGEDHFRLLESRLLHQFSASSRSFVMATGGGAPCFFRGMEIINDCGLSIFLDCPVPELLQRVKKNHERPLLLISDEAELREKLVRMRDARLACYNQSKIVMESPTLQAVLEKLQATS